MPISFDERDFLKRYRGTEKFIREGEKYYRAFLDLLQDNSLLEKIKFANDVLGAPPLSTFILYHRNEKGGDLFRSEIRDSYIKQGLGACFGYLYRFCYRGYVPEQCRFNDPWTGIKTVSRFKRGEREKNGLYEKGLFEVH